MALSVLITGVLLLAIDGTVLYLAVPSLSRELEPTAEQLLWIGDIYSLALACLLVIMGTASDRVGRKRLLLIGVAAFGLSSLLAAFAATPETLIAARALLRGLRGGHHALHPRADPEHLHRPQGAHPGDRDLVGGVRGRFGDRAAGGRLTARHFWWGSVFLVNVPVMLVMLVAGIVLLPESKNPTPGRFDVWSAVLSLATVTPLVYAIKHTVASGFDPVTAACLIGGLAADTSSFAGNDAWRIRSWTSNCFASQFSAARSSRT